jgi:hypothetical protein
MTQILRSAQDDRHKTAGAELFLKLRGSWLIVGKSRRLENKSSLHLLCLRFVQILHASRQQGGR